MTHGEDLVKVGWGADVEVFRTLYCLQDVLHQIGPCRFRVVKDGIHFDIPLSICQKKIKQKGG